VELIVVFMTKFSVQVPLNKTVTEMRKSNEINFNVCAVGTQSLCDSL
jgi:hypothetical protein